MDSQQRATSGPPSGQDAGRMATMFVIKLVVFTLALGFGEAYLHQINWGGFLQDWVASVAGRLASMCDSSITREGNIIFAKDQMLLVTLECTALFAKGLFCAAAIAFPCTWRARLLGCVVGIVGVGILNVLRISGLVLIAQWVPGFFHFAHLVLMQWFLISCVAPLWLAWAVWTGRRARAMAEGTKGSAVDGG